MQEARKCCSPSRWWPASVCSRGLLWVVYQINCVRSPGPLLAGRDPAACWLGHGATRMQLCCFLDWKPCNPSPQHRTCAGECLKPSLLHTGSAARDGQGRGRWDSAGSLMALSAWGWCGWYWAKVKRYLCAHHTLLYYLGNKKGHFISQSTSHALFLTFSQGLGCGLLYTATVTITCHYFDKRRGLALGLISTGMTFSCHSL